jgi:hypothetical protein
MRSVENFKLTLTYTLGETQRILTSQPVTLAYMPRKVCQILKKPVITSYRPMPRKVQRNMDNQ